LQTIPFENGLVAFLDILGFKKMLSANALEHALQIINTCILKELAETEKIYGSKFKIRTFVISDSILIALPDITARGAFVFTLFCNHFICGLLIKGLPVRGAIAGGKFSIQTADNQIIFAGQPIIVAHELADSLEIAACVVDPSSKSKILNNLTCDLFQVHVTPIKKNQTHNLYLLKYGIGFSRKQINQYFEDHKKQLDDASASKLNNTIEFLNNCGELKPD